MGELSSPLAMFNKIFLVFLSGCLSSCKITWQFPESCSSVRSSLVSQMESWEGDSLCPGTSPQCPQLPCGQRCPYQHTGGDTDTLHGTHTTPVARYAILDKGTNYCNLRNLVEGAGLTSSDGFSEDTRNGVCTQYSSRDCSRY